MAAGDEYSAVGGTFTAPGITAVKINGGQVSKQTLAKRNITGPGDNGSVKWSFGNYSYAFSGRGVYVESATASDTLDQGVSGTATVQLGNGEQWTGPALIEQIQADADWGPGGSIGVLISFTWNGTPTISHPS